MPRPFVKWSGGKRQLLPELIKYVPEKFERYYEPFVGGGALFWHLQPKSAVLGDINDELIVSYRVIRERCEKLIDVLTLHGRAHSRAHFEHMRDVNFVEANVESRAARFIYLNKTCFNGLYRVNKSGKFNVPFGDYANPTICDAENLRACAAALKTVITMHGDFEETTKLAESGDFVYFDPPYIPVSKTSFTAYDKSGFGRADHVRLRDCALHLKRCGAYVLLSNSSAPLVEELYGRDFELIPVQGKRSINSKGTGRGPVKEWIIR